MTGLLILIFLTAMAVLGPILGADSRDSLDWREGLFPGKR
jgi:hypothetical protein